MHSSRAIGKFVSDMRCWYRRFSAVSLAARVDPGLVDVTATLGYQQVISSGTGMVLTPIAAGQASAAVHIGATAFLGVQVVSYGVPVPGNPAIAGAGVAGITRARQRPDPDWYPAT